MKTVDKVIKSVKALLVATTIIFTMVQCADEEIVVQETLADDINTYANAEVVEVGSLSVSGLYTEIEGDVVCATCSYLVDPKETTVDGKVIGLKPGSVVCLRKSLKYGALDFINMEGTEEEPIVIGYCAE